MNAIYRESWPEVVPARPRDELAKILDAPSESAEVAPHRSEHGGVGDHRGEVHVRDQWDREREALVQTGERQRQRATEAQAHHGDRSLVLGQQPAEQGASIEEVLAQRLEAAHQVSGPVELTA